MRLDDCTEITIKGKDVRKIEMKNMIVWEKEIATALHLSSNVSSTVFLDSINFTVRLTGNGSGLSEKVQIYDGSNLVGTITTTNGTGTFNYTSSNVGNHEFHAVFNGNNAYGESISNIVPVNIIKDTPTLTSLTSNIYTGWNIGAVLKNSKGTALGSKNIILSGSTTGTLTTNSSGKVTKSFSGSAGASYTVTYKFKGDDHYNECTLSKTFTINKPLIQSKCTGTMTSGGSTGSYREWVDVHSNCDDNYARCTNIASASGTHKIPALLSGKITFNIPTGARVTNLKADWKSKIVKYTSSSGYAKIGAPTVTVSDDGSGGSHTKTSGTPGNNTYVSGTFNYSGATYGGLNDGVNVKVQFPANTGGDIGQIYFVGVKLTATYIPKQGSI